MPLSMAVFYSDDVTINPAADDLDYDRLGSYRASVYSVVGNY
jgi:hypothetical protein